MSDKRFAVVQIRDAIGLKGAPFPDWEVAREMCGALNAKIVPDYLFNWMQFSDQEHNQRDESPCIVEIGGVA